MCSEVYGDCARCCVDVFLWQGHTPLSLRTSFVTVCCCGALSCLRLGGRKNCSLCHLCAKSAGGSAPGDRRAPEHARVEWVRTSTASSRISGLVRIGEVTTVTGAGPDRVRMHKTSLRSGTGAVMTGGAVAVLRPPKPPCWRDFVAQDSIRKDHVTPPSSFIQPDIRNIADLTGGMGGGGDVIDSYSVGGGRLSSQLNLPGSTGKTSRSTKRVRARIHRTRSEHLIDVEELPEGELTVSLADTRPHDLKMHVRPAAEVDERLYTEENNRRCQSWLASIEAAEPLDDIGYKDSKEVALEEVDVEVPEETFSWLGEEEEGERERVKPPLNTSTSSSDTEGLLQHVMAAVGLADPGYDGSDEEDEDNSKQAPTGRGRGRGSNGGGGRGGLRSTSSSLNVHRQLSSKHILSLSEHSGLE